MFAGAQTQGNENSHIEVNHLKNFSIAEVENKDQTENYKDVLNTLDVNTTSQTLLNKDKIAKNLSNYPNNEDINNKENHEINRIKPTLNENVQNQVSIFKIRSPVVYKPKTPIQPKFKIKAVVKSEIKSSNLTKPGSFLSKQESRHIR